MKQGLHYHNTFFNGTLYNQIPHFLKKTPGYLHVYKKFLLKEQESYIIVTIIITDFQVDW